MRKAAITPFTLSPLPVRTPQWKRLAAIIRNPMTMYAEEHFTRSMVHAPIGKRTFAQVMMPELAQQILQGDGKEFGRSIFIQRLLQPALRGGLLTTDGDIWRKQRRAAAPAFRQIALDGLVPSFARAGERLADRLLAARDTTLDVSPEMVKATFDVIVDTLLAENSDTYPQADIAHDIDLFLNSIGRLALSDIFPFLDSIAPRRFFVRGYGQGMEAISRLRALATDIVASRMQTPDDGDDLTGQLIRAEDPATGDRLSAEDLVDNVLTFVGAGHETTALALTWTLYVLAQTPVTQEALAEEAFAVLGNRTVTSNDVPKLEFHERTVKEVMRLFPPVPIIGRSVVKDVHVGGQDFHPGDHIAIAIYPMHRHKKLWRDPGAFDPDRFLSNTDQHRYQYLPFGGGPRVCIGMKFAIMEAVAMLASVMRTVRVELPPGKPPEPYLTITMRPKGGMPLIIRGI